MKVHEAYKVLKDPKMSNLECNFKIVKKKKITLEDVVSEMNKGFKQVNDRINQVETNLNIRIDKIEARLDRIVKLNNLKE